MKFEAIKQITARPADRVHLMGGDKPLVGPLHFRSMATTASHNTWLVFKRDQGGKAHSHKYVAGDKILMIDPSNDDAMVIDTNAQ